MRKMTEAEERATWDKELARAQQDPSAESGSRECRIRRTRVPKSAPRGRMCTCTPSSSSKEGCTSPWPNVVPGCRGSYFASLPAIAIFALTKLSGSAIIIFVVAWRRWSMRRDVWITLPNQQLAHFGMSKTSRRRGLASLAKAGLVMVEPRGPNRAPMVALHPALYAALPRRRR
jgi:hypothetical protein